MSSVKKLSNGISNIEEESDRKIPYSSYYIVYIKIKDANVAVTDFVKKILRTEKTNPPLIAYVFRYDVYLLFSCLEKSTDSHYLDGSHHRLISEYVCKFYNGLSSPSIVCIVEFDTRTKIMIYFQYKVFENIKKTICSLSRKKMTMEEIDSITLQESIGKLEKYLDIKWNDIPNEEKYGTFYRYVTDLETKKQKFVTLSENIDSTSTSKYATFFF